MLEFVDCQNLAGAFSLASVNVGFKMKHCTSLEGFGVENKTANRHILGDDWEVEIDGDWASWTPQQTPFISGTPPCSGFSLMNRNNTGQGNVRGPNSPINDCMWALAKYAGNCTGGDGKPGPEVISFESVQQAGRSGRLLMQMLRDEISNRTKQEYTLTHVFLSGSSCGAPQYRKRYFFVAHRVPFGVESPLVELPYGDGSPVERVATYGDAIADLIGLDPDTWDPQYVANEPTWWSRELRNDTNTVDAHITAANPHAHRLESIAKSPTGWEPGEPFISAILRHVQEFGSLPEPWKNPEELNYARLQWGGPVRIYPDKPGYVITGMGGANFVHWAEPRLLSVRECARLMCFPDDWTWAAAKSVTQAYAWVGKQIPVKSGMYLAGWAKRAIEGRPGSWQGEEIGEREYSIDVTHDYKAIYNDRTREHGVDSRSREQKEAMERRKTQQVFV